jgi:adenylyltransferase/sulfurtransferase
LQIPEISPLDLRRQIESKTPPCLLDVREPEEHALVSLPEAVLIPLMALQSRLEEIRSLSAEGSQEIVVYCRSGKRSQLAVEWLLGQGIKNIFNLSGGINAYAKEADQTLTPY